MIKVDQFMDIKELQQQGHSIRDIARITGLARNTIRKVLRGEHAMKMQPSPRDSLLDPFKDYLCQRFQEHGLSAVRLLEEIQPMGYTGSIATLRRYVSTLRQTARRQGKLTVRFETPPGQQAQADWAYCGRFPLPDGRIVPVYAFVMVLSFSRMLFVRFTTSMRMRELLECHQEAFAYFGGWPGCILYDNMKQVKLSAFQWNEQFLDFAQHYGFVPKTHRVRRPRTKGKVERMVDYLKDDFLTGRTFHGLDDLNAQARQWATRSSWNTARRPRPASASSSVTTWPSFGRSRSSRCRCLASLAGRSTSAPRC